MDLIVTQKDVDSIESLSPVAALHLKAAGNYLAAFHRHEALDALVRAGQNVEQAAHELALSTGEPETGLPLDVATAVAAFWRDRALAS